jgi:predicted MPP superfamily phosphohydrolase
MQEQEKANIGRSLSRRQLLKIVAGSLVGAGISGSLYSYFLEPYWLVVERHKLTFNPTHNPPTKLRIAHLSDLHRSDIVPAAYLNECVTKVNSLKPDLILLTGDYITWEKNWAESVGEILSPLEAGLGVFASLGNHDGGDWAGFPSDTVRRRLEKAGICVLVNEYKNLSFGSVPITIVGLGDLWAGDFDTGTAFNKVDPECFTIALSHNPDTVPFLSNCSANLILCGHTHGGQVWIPLLGPPILPVDDRRFSAGVYGEGEQIIYVNRGVGLLRKVRFNCRPEIALIEIA